MGPGQGQLRCNLLWLRHFGRLSPEHLRLDADTPHTGFLILHLRSYPAWKVSVNGHDVPSARKTYPNFARRDDGLMAVPVPQGAVNWMSTGPQPATCLGRLLSIMSLGCLIVALFSRAKAGAASAVKPSVGDELGYHK